MSRSTVVRRSAIAALVMAWPAIASSQVCTGHASWRDGSLRVGANYLSYPASNGTAGAKKYGADYGGGLSNGLFASAALMRTAYADDIFGTGSSSSAVSLAATIGFPVWQSSDKAFAFCPTAGGERQWGPNGTFSFLGTSTKVKISMNTIVLGGSAGRTIAARDNLNVIPFGAATYQSGATTGDLSGSVTDHTTTTTDYGLLEAGIGFVIKRTFTIRPSVERPFGLGSGAKPSNAYSLTASWNFGRSR
jgi:hypothetical protein